MSDLDARKILVIRLSSLGDVVLTTALFPNLRARWPMARITVVTKPAFSPVFDRNPSVHEVLTFDGKTRTFGDLASRIKSEKWDVVIDLHANPRSWFLRLVAGGDWTVTVEKASFARNLLVLTKRALPVLRRSVRDRILDCLAPLGAKIVSSETQLFPADASSLLAAHGITPDDVLIGVAPGAKHATKRWLPERFAAAAERLASERRAVIVLLGDKSDLAAADAVRAAINGRCINLTGKTTLSELIAVTSRLSYLLTNDSGLMHIGEALGIPLTVVFGPTVREFGFSPYRETSRLVQTSLSCRPCTLHGGDRCPLGHHRCMTDVSMEAALGK